MKDIEELSTSNRLQGMMYKKTGLYLLYPFLMFVVAITVGLFIFQRDLVISLTGMISNPEVGTIMISNVSGVIDDVFVRNNQEITAGETLLVLDKTDILRAMRYQQDEINDYEERLDYLNVFEQSIVSGENLLPSDAFGFSLRLEQHFRLLQSDGVALNHLTTTRNQNVGRLTSEISRLETLVADYQNFNRLVSDLDYQPIINGTVDQQVREFRTRLRTFNADMRDERRIFIATTQSQISQNIANRQSEIRALNQELQNIDRSYQHETASFDGHELNASESLIIEIFSLRENVLIQLYELERQMAALRRDYDAHTIVSTVNGRFIMKEELAIGQAISSHNEFGRIINVNQEDNYILSYFPSADFSRMTIDQTVILTLVDGNHERHLVQGSIRMIGETPIHTEQGNQFILEASIDKPASDLMLRYGMVGELNVITGRTSWWNYLVRRLF